MRHFRPDQSFRDDPNNLAARFKLTAYDASYLALAGTLQCPLCTFDKRLADAAQLYLAGPAEPAP